MPTYTWKDLIVNVHYAGAFTDYPDWSKQRANHYTALWYLVEGDMDFLIDGQFLAAKQGSVVLLPPATPFRSRCVNNDRVRETIIIRFTLSTPQNLDWFKLYRMPILFPNLDRRFHEGDFQEVVSAMQGESPFHQLQTQALAQLLLYRFLEIHVHHIQPISTVNNKTYFQVIKVIHWLDTHLTKKFTLGDLAALIHVSTDGLNDKFRSVTGMTPMHYANHLRIQKAKNYLLQNELSIKEICFKVGISDPYYFSRLFKKFEGLSPTEYKNSIHSI